MVTIKTEEEIKIMKEGGKILADVLSRVAKMAKPGVTTRQLNDAAEMMIAKYGAKPSFKGYMNFPFALCTSINEEIVHVKPSDRALKEGDIICLDLGVLYKRYNTDMALTVGVGRISREAKGLMKITKKVLDLAIKKVKPGVNTNDIGGTIEDYIESRGFGVVRELCGHGIGKELHEDPQLPNFRDERKEGFVLKKGMVICLEPMVTMGDWRIKKAKDNYGFQTKDNSLSAHFELTIAVTERGAMVLTK